MPGDKQVNININYKVNTVEVQKAEQLLKQAQTASTSFENSAKKAGNTTSTAFKAAGLSIQEMNAKLLSLKDRITQSSNPQLVKRLSDEYKKLKTQIDAANRAAFETPKAIAETGKATQSLAGQLGGLYTAVKLAFTAGIIKELATTAIEMAKLSGNVEGVRNAFNRTFPDAESLLFKLRKSTHGTLTDFELMQKALKAQNLGVPVQEFAKVLEFAATRAQQTGDSVEYLVNSIVDGLGRKSILKLDNLGVSATRLKEAMGGISTQAATVAQVTEAFTKIAGEELQKMGGYAETSATQVDQLTVSFAKLRQELSQAIEASSFVTFVKGYVDSFVLLLEARRNGNTVAEQSAENLRKEIAQMSAADFTQRNLTKSKEENNKILEEEIQSLTKEVGQWAKLKSIYEDQIKSKKQQSEQIKDDLKLGKISYADAQTNIQIIKEEIEQKQASIDVDRDDILIRQELIRIYQAQILANKKLKEPLKEELGIIEKLKIEIEAFGYKIDKATSFEDIKRLNDELKILQATLTDLQNSTNQFNPLASVTFDIKAKLSTGKVKLKIGDVVNTEGLEKDTTDLFNKLGVKAGEEFNKGLKEPADRAGLEDALAARREELISANIDITANALTELASMEADSYTQRLRSLSLYYDEQILLAGDNDKAKDRLRLEEKKKTDKLRREEARKEQQARLYAILINTAAGIAKAFATSATVYDAYINAGLVAVEGAAQYAIASKGPKGFKEGVLNLQGKGTGTSDSIPAKLSKGESVMTADEWKTSKNVLKEVRAKRLDDDVLSSLKLGNNGVKVIGGMDDKRMIAKLDEIKNSMPDVEARGHLLYTTKKKSDNYRQWVRKSSMSS